MYPTEKIALTKSLIDKLPLSTDGKQITIYDKTLMGFGLRIGATSKTFIVYKRIANGAPKRITLGKYGALTVDQARQLAQEELFNLSKGVDSNKIKKEERKEQKVEERVEKETLGWLIDFYKDEHLIKNKGGASSTLKNIETAKDYFSEKTITLLKKENEKWVEDKEVILPDWLNRPYRSITKKEILERFDYLSVAKPTRFFNGVVQPVVRTHQMSFKYLNAAFNFIIPRQEGGDSFINPCDVLKSYKKWKNPNKRTRRININTADGIKWLWHAFDYRGHNFVGSNYIIFSLLQAGRSIEIAPLQWQDIDLINGKIYYRNTKNKENYEFPITKVVEKILIQQQKRKQAEKSNSDYVFAYEGAYKYGHINKTAKPYFEDIHKKCGILISHHDLRRTWATTAHGLNINERTIDFCLKHKLQDVNVHYIDRDFDLMKQALQQVEDFFMSKVIAYDLEVRKTQLNELNYQNELFQTADQSFR